MEIRDRIKELRRVRACDLKPNPKNWRVHPPQQADALRGLLAEVGLADALLARELSDGSLQLVDGHLRAETCGDQPVPVLVLDVDEREADKLLAALDPIVGLAEADEGRVAALLEHVQTDNEALQGLLDRLAGETANLDDAIPAGATAPEIEIPASYQVVVECDGERQQREVFERLTREGYKCRVLTL